MVSRVFDGGERVDRVTDLGLHVVKGRWRDDGEADQKDVSLGVRKRTKTVVVFLASSIPEGELYVFAIYAAVCDIVLEYGRSVPLERSGAVRLHLKVRRHVVAAEIVGLTYLREISQCEDAQKTGLAASTIANDD